ncbi:MAG: uncharacterized protein K0S08_2134 [Gammaproteobacteria bacterium]|jgi:uncharacterized protein YciI|nr:uncharacterized protein [Gammaproteobacteria bacterium]
MFVVLLDYLVPLEIVEQYLSDHRAYLEKAYQKNFLIASGPKNPRAGGVLISQLKDRAKLEEWLAQDPFQVNDIAKYTIIEFTPTKCHPDFENLIA